MAAPDDLDVLPWRAGNTFPDTGGGGEAGRAGPSVGESGEGGAAGGYVEVVE